jgi:hypothetical protein
MEKHLSARHITTYQYTQRFLATEAPAATKVNNMHITHTLIWLVSICISFIELRVETSQPIQSALNQQLEK